jgi:hypothetical protein
MALATFAERTLKLLSERLASAMNSRFDRAFGDAKDFGDLSVGEAFDVVQDDRHAKGRLQILQSVAHLLRQFVA